ncbi:hypothetical protein BSKO_01619 [Bryopsis sp. KO-2023]|nr:hypothetical protein BSKO_01619 [Bryopsis sp. KO-2023]
MQPNPIVPLSNAVISQVRSSSQICSLAHAVEEVVANSIDAESTCIAVTVDLNEYSFSVKDNGCGIEPSSMTHVCKRHCTSKSRTSSSDGEMPCKFGYRGESLASIAEMAVVHITSRGQGSFETLSKIVRGGKVLKCGVSLKARTQSGTTVSVRNFMYNRPVRQKQAIRTRSQQCKEMSLIRENLFRMLLPAPHVELGLYVTGDEEPLLHLKQGRTKESSLQYIFNDRHSSLVHLSQTLNSMSIEGSILLPPLGHHSKEKQYFYVNGRHMHCKKASEIIGHFFKRVCENLDKAGGWTVEGAAGSRYPGFILNVSCPRHMYEMNREPDRPTVVFSDPSRISNLVKGALLEVWGSVLSNSMIQELEHRGRKSRKEVGHAKSLSSGGGEGIRSNGKSSRQRRSVEDSDRERIKGADRVLFVNRRASFMAPSLSSRRRSLGCVNGADFVSDAERNAKLRKKDCTNDSGEAKGRLDNSGSSPQIDLEDIRAGAMEEEDPRWVERGELDDSHLNCAMFDKGRNLGERENNSPKRKLREWDVAADMEDWRGGGSLGSGDVLNHGSLGSINVFDQGGGGECEPWEDLLEPNVDLQSSDQEGVTWGQSNHVRANKDPSQLKSFLNMRQHHGDKEWQSLSRRMNAVGNFAPNNREDSGWEMPPFPNASEEIDDFVMDAASDGGLTDGDVIGEDFPPLYSGLDSPVQKRGEGHSGCALEVEGMANENSMHTDLYHVNEEDGVLLSDFLASEGGCFDDFTDPWDQEDKETNENHHRPPSPVPELNHTGVVSASHRRAMSAPPHPQNRHKGFHSNPLMSLKTRHPFDKEKLNSRVDGNFLTSQRGTFRGVQSVLDPENSAMNQRKGVRMTFLVGSIAKNANGHAIASNAVPNTDKNAVEDDSTLGRASTKKRVRFIDEKGKISLSGRLDCKMKSNPMNETDKEEVPSQRNGLHPNLADLDKDISRAHRKTSRKILNLDDLLDDFSDPPIAALHEQQISSIQDFAPVRCVVPQSISRAVFEQARILCQVGRKFVLMVCGEVVVAVDQHAADERVRLEMLQKDLVSVGHESGLIQAEELDGSLAINLTHLEQQVFETYKQKVEHWGWKGKLDPQNGNLILTHRPLLFGSPMNSTELKIYLNHLEDTGGSDILPPCVLRVLKSKACRSAVMFGDALCFSKCCDMIADLKKTRFCFSCAHGRPTMVPLADVASLRKAINTDERGSDVLDVPKQGMSLAALKKYLNTPET